MNVLVINCGSSSVKAAVIAADSGRRLVELLVERVGTGDATAEWGDDAPVSVDAPDHAAALNATLQPLLDRLPAGEAVGAVGHRVVHGGELYTAPTLLDDAVVAAIDELSALAPLHNPANVAGIRAARALLPDLPHVAVFDTAFHAGLPRRARTYALPKALRERHGLQRYGFHGTSHEYVARRAAAWLGEPLDALRVVTAHLGNGASVCAVEYGHSVETSMGMTPLEGLVMGTRSGDVDPGVLLHLMQAEGLDAAGLDALLNRESGIAGLSGVGHDLRDVLAGAEAGDDACRLALHVYTHRVQKYLGAYAAVMGGVDAIAFCAGVGENSAQIRAACCQRLDFLGARLDPERNAAARVGADDPVAPISAESSRVALLVVATDEAHAIAEHVAELLSEHQQVAAARPIPIAVSARHVHLTQEAVEALFGPGHQLTSKVEISQPGQFACEERVTLIGPRRSIEGVRVIGPTRARSQVEISRTDEFTLGVDAPVRNSGDLDGTPGITLEGPAGRLALDEGLICAARHIHMHPDDAAAFGVADRDIVEVAIDSEGRDVVYGDVLVRVKPSYALEMHLDTDEANAAELVRGATGVFARTTGRASVRKRTSRPRLTIPEESP